MMVSVRVVAVAVLVVVMVAVAAEASAPRRVNCQVVRCANPREEECGPAGGLFIPADYVTRCCSVCVKYVGEDETCGNLVQLPVPTCSAGLDCDPESSVCVRPRGPAA